MQARSDRANEALRFFLECEAAFPSRGGGLAGGRHRLRVERLPRRSGRAPRRWRDGRPGGGSEEALPPGPRHRPLPGGGAAPAGSHPPALGRPRRGRARSSSASSTRAAEAPGRLSPTSSWASSWSSVARRRRRFRSTAGPSSRTPAPAGGPRRGRRSSGAAAIARARSRSSGGAAQRVPRRPADLARLPPGPRPRPPRRSTRCERRRAREARRLSCCCSSSR